MSLSGDTLNKIIDGFNQQHENDLIPRVFV